jgi:riboflavin synthase alpha subunit
MFTGIVRERGRIANLEGGTDGVHLVVEAPATASQAALGDSVAVSGICLTVVAAENGTLAFDAVPETLRRSSLEDREPGDFVNLEPALRAGEPLGGHYVQGHVDGVGVVRVVENRGIERRLGIAAPKELRRYIVEKGSVAVEGVSLTVADLANGRRIFTVALVPHTLEVTTLGDLHAGSKVNLEVDVLAKYVESLVARS